MKIVNKSNNPLPKIQTKGSAGFDLMASTITTLTIKPNETKLIKTGLFIEIPKGYEGQIRGRSSLLFKGILTHLGTIDSDYRGEIGVIMTNLTDDDFWIDNGDRIAQIVFNKIEHFNFQEAQELKKTDRGVGGFGSTGKN